LGGGSDGVFVHEPLDGVGAEAAPGAGREQRFVGGAGSFAQPHAEDGFGGCRQRDGAVLAALAFAADVRAGAEADVAAVEAGQLGHAQSGLDGDQQQGPVTSALPARQVGGVDEGVDLGGGEERHDPLVETFRRDGKDSLDEPGVFGVPQSGVGEQ
jgi:hypothetical protein